ncbi:MAG TPA: NUDIX hydrolase [Thermoanaerobaculia bacterium]|nr:NUDIX hydrolase [Thermoanaerobaculia bacterium]
MDLRSQTLLDDLGAYPPADDRERASLERMMRFVSSAATPFDRANPEGHVTGSAVVARADGSAFLLVRHRKLDRWLQPGGHCDPMDGGVLGTALREATEETGVEDLVPALDGRPLDVDVHPIPARGEEPAHLHYDVRYLVTSEEPAGEHAAGEVSDVGWFALDEALAMGVDESLARCLKKAKRILVTRGP